MIVFMQMMVRNNQATTARFSSQFYKPKPTSSPTTQPRTTRPPSQPPPTTQPPTTTQLPTTTQPPSTTQPPTTTTSTPESQPPPTGCPGMLHTLLVVIANISHINYICAHSHARQTGSRLHSLLPYRSM